MPIDELGPCLTWGGAKTMLGYGQVRIRKGDRTTSLVHRVMYADSRGLTLTDLDGWVIRHRCDNPSCFHPGHLQIGTQADNMRDKRERNRQIHTPAISDRQSKAQRQRFEGSPVTDETRRRLSEAHRGHQHSAETRSKMSASHMGRKASDETKTRLRAAWALRRATKESVCP